MGRALGHACREVTLLIATFCLWLQPTCVWFDVNRSKLSNPPPKKNTVCLRAAHQHGFVDTHDPCLTVISPDFGLGAPCLRKGWRAAYLFSRRVIELVMW